MKKNATKVNGFTLLEIMMTVAIMGILSAVAAPNLISYKDKAFCKKAESDAGAIALTIVDFLSVPSNTNLITLNNNKKNKKKKFEINNDGSINCNANITCPDDINFPKLSANNTANVEEENSSITITITDSEERCPEKYQDAIPEWDNFEFTREI